MFTIAKRFDFSASHVLDGVPQKHPCSRLHGHNWTVTLFLAASEVDERGFVVDFLDLAAFKCHIESELDHRHLNDVVPFAPTSENLARHLYGVARKHWPQVVACAISETSRTSAVYAPEVALILSG